MRTFVTVLTTAAILCGIASASWAEEPAPKAPPSDAKKVDPKVQAVAFAKLQVKMHRTLADLIEARVAEKLEKSTIEKLQKELDQIRSEMRAQRPAPSGRPGFPPGGTCPWGGPNMGHGRGPGGGPGPGMGPGPGWGGGRGPERGFGMGPPPRWDGERGRAGNPRDMGPGPGRDGGPGPAFGPGPDPDMEPEDDPGLPPGPPPRGPQDGDRPSSDAK